MKRRRRNGVDSDEGSDVGSQASDSNSAINSSRTAVKQKLTARKRGKVPSATKKVRILQEDSDDGGSTRPNTPQNSDNDQSGEDNSSDSGCAANSSKATVKQKPTARKRGRPPSLAKKTAQTLQDNSDDGGSTQPNTPRNPNNVQSEEDNSDSDSAANSSKATVKQKPTARKRGRPPSLAKKTAQTLQDNSDDGGSTRPNTPDNPNNDQSEEDNSDSDSMANSSIAAVKQKLTARKRGRPPAATKKKAQTVQDDSDDEESMPPSTPQNADSDQSDNEDNSSDSDYIADSISGPKRRPGRPSSANKRLRLQNGPQRDTSPQPSTSNGIIHQVPETESESDSNSADSDFGPVNEKNVKKKQPGKKQLGRKTSPRAAKKKITSYASSINASVNNSQLSASFKKGIKPSQTFDASMDTNLVESLAQKLVYFLLIEDQKKYAIRRKGIITHVLKDDNTPKMYSAVTKKANIILKKTYGMELMKLENQTDSYLLINILGRELGVHDYIDLPRMKQQQHGLISFLLTVIYMNENVITEDELTRCLKPLGIDLTSKRMHPVFGDVKKYITTELVKQMYLKYECISKEPPKYEFTWGLRAKQEFDKRDLLQFACTIMDDTSPEDWRMQFRDAEASAKPNIEN